MSQHDFNIANQTSGNARTDLNNAFAALATLSSGATAPATTFANMLWYDTANDALKMRNEADSGWIVVAYINQSTAKLELADNTSIVSAVGTQTGLLGGQSTATWEAGTSTTESLVSPANVKAAIDALVTVPTVDTADVLSATAGASAGAVGSYVLAWRTTYTVSANMGSTLSGSNLKPANTNQGSQNDVFQNLTLSGTWRQMGYIWYSGDQNSTRGGTTLWLRIS